MPGTNAMIFHPKRLRFSYKGLLKHLKTQPLAMRCTQNALKTKKD